jgi:hypothetical protein
MKTRARWNLVVSQDTDNAVRQFLARQGRVGKGELSRFVEDAVRSSIFETEVRQVKARNRDVPQDVIEAAIDEALEWARRT